MEFKPDMQQSAERTIRTLHNKELLIAFTIRLNDWLLSEAVENEETAPSFTHSRAKAVLRASDVVDDATLQDFTQLMSQERAVRVAVYDLLVDSDLAENEEAANLAQLSALEGTKDIPWLSMIIASYAWRSGYPLYQIDPSSPPATFSPAGQVLTRSAHFVRRQVQRSATEREKLGKQLSVPRSGTPALDEMDSADVTLAPLPPHYRPPIPENYPEVSSESFQIESDDIEQAPSITLGDPLVISAEDVNEPGRINDDPIRMPPITISSDQIAAEPAAPPSPVPRSGVIMPSESQTPQARPSLTVGLRQMLGQEELTTTKLRIFVQQYPDGPGLYGLQVRVTCKGVKSYVAGTTDREGRFVCELPVRMQSGLTYDVDITWPREQGNEVERKSITLNSERSHFTLPFYRQLTPPETNSTGQSE